MRLACCSPYLYVTFDKVNHPARHFDYARLDWAFVNGVQPLA